MENLSDLRYDDMELNDEWLLTSYGITEGSTLEFSIFKNGREDIGVYDYNHDGKVGNEFLKSGCQITNAHSMIESLKGNPKAKYQYFPPGLISNETLLKLRQLIDGEYHENDYNSI